MAEVTAASMQDARDAEDKRLFDEGRIDELLAGWVETIRGRCVAKMRGPVGLDVAQAVCLRLWRELKAGKHRDGAGPFRVVVHNVIGWACAGWYEHGWGEVELIETWSAGSNEPMLNINVVILVVILFIVRCTLPVTGGLECVTPSKNAFVNASLVFVLLSPNVDSILLLLSLLPYLVITGKSTLQLD